MFERPLRRLQLFQLRRPVVSADVLPTAVQALHGRTATHPPPLWLPDGRVPAVRRAAVGLLPALLEPVALAAGLVALPGDAAGRGLPSVLRFPGARPHSAAAAQEDRNLDLEH